VLRTKSDHVGASPSRDTWRRMGKENIEIYRSALDAFNRRDKAAFLAVCDPDLENVPPREWPESRRVRGAEAVWDFLVENQDPWQEATFEVVEPIEASGDGVVAQVRGELRGSASGAGVPWLYWHAVRFRGGTATEFRWFADRAEAVAAAGIPN
jgi:ketosteroid isomerase-like protein